MPAGAGSRARRPHRDVAAADAIPAMHATRPGHREWVRSDGSSAQRFLLPLRGKKAQFSAFLLRQSVAIAGFVVMRRKLLQQLLDAVLLTNAVHVGDLVLGERAEVLMDFLDVESWRHPGVFLEGATGVVVGSRVVMLR